MIALERRLPPRPPPRPEIAWLGGLTVPELCVLVVLMYEGATEEHPLLAALVAAGRARLAGHVVAPLAVAPPLGHMSANVGAITGSTSWFYPPNPPP